MFVGENSWQSTDTISSIHWFYKWARTALVRVCECTGLSEPLLAPLAIRAFFPSCTSFPVNITIGLDKSEYQVNSFLITWQKHMLWYSFEAPRWGASNEYPQHTGFFLRNKRNIDTFWWKKAPYDYHNFIYPKYWDTLAPYHVYTGWVTNRSDRVTSSEKVLLNVPKMPTFRSACACAKYHRAFAVYSYILSYPVSLLGDSEGPDQTARMCTLIWVFTVCIYLKTCFCMAQPRHCSQICLYRVCLGLSVQRLRINTKHGQGEIS